MKRILFIFILFFLASILYEGKCQTRNYNDVVLIINENSSISDSVGAYFIAQRKIKHVCRVNTATTEEINDSIFRNLADQIKNFLLALSKGDSINYLITTKGVPLKVARPDPPNYDFEKNASVESEIALIGGPYESLIARAWQVISPYEDAREKFSRRKFGVYLVTRLDGYNFNDIKKIIDNAAPDAPSPSHKARFVFDQDPLYNNNGWAGKYLNDQLTKADSIVKQRGYNSLLDTTEKYITNEKDVMGYVSWGSNDHNDPSNNGIANNTYANGAIATTYVSTSARTLNKPVTYPQSLIADLVADGVSGVMGHVYEPFSNAHAKPSVLFERYTSGEFNLVESFAMSSRYLSWMEVTIGDPKCHFKKPKDPVNVQAQEVTLHNFVLEQNYPNPFNPTTTIEYKLFERSDVQLEIYTLLGQKIITLINKKQNVGQYRVTWDGKNLNGNKVANGIYFYCLRSGKYIEKKKMILLK